MMIFLLFSEPIAKKTEYFAALGSPKVKLFKGPGSTYPLLYILTQRYYPVKVIGEFDHWCRVQCPDGETGWIRKCYLSTKYRRSIILSECFLYTKHSETSGILAKLHKDVFLRVKKRENNCSYVIVNGNLKGWVQNHHIW